MDTHKKNKRTCPGGQKCKACHNIAKKRLARITRREAKLRLKKEGQ